MAKEFEKHYMQSLDKLYLRGYKDTLFRLIFREKENLLSLYNAMNDTDYEKAEELKIVTLENAIYMGMKNDVAFLLYDELYLYEHQSTPNPNMPLRNLFYIAREYEKLIDKQSIYRSKAIRIPAPHFVVFYNGTIPEPEKKLLQLSDLYSKKEEQPELELTVQVLNINVGKNEKLLNHCKMLQDYTKYVDRIRKYAILLPIEEAVERALQECVNEGILAELLTKYRREVVQVSIFEFDTEKEFKLLREAEREVGYEEGVEAGIRTGKELGRTEGKLLQLLELVQDGSLSLSVAAKKAGISEAEFEEKMKIPPTKD